MGLTRCYKTEVFLHLSLSITQSVGVSYDASSKVLWLRRYTSEYQVKIGVFAPKGSVWLKISGRRKGSPLTNHSYCQETRMNDLSCGIRMWAQVISFCYSPRGQTDRRLYRGYTVHCIACSRTVNMYTFWCDNQLLLAYYEYGNRLDSLL